MRRGHLSHQRGICVEQRLARGVHYGYVVDVPPIARNGLQQIVEADVGLNVICKSAPQGRGITGIHRCAAEIGHGVSRRIGQLMREAGRGLIGTDNAQTQNLGNIQVRERRHQHCHHKGDDQHDDGFTSHDGRALRKP